MANPITIIKKDHRNVEVLFSRYEELGVQAFKTKQDLVTQIINELRVHAEMEEAIPYPAFEKQFSKEGDAMVEEAIAEHDVAKTLMTEIETLSPEDPQFDAKVKVLNEVINHHVKEEEEELLPKAQTEINADEFERLGDEMLCFKKERGAE